VSARRMAGSLATLALIALALVGRADAFVYWTEKGIDTIGRANLDSTGVDLTFVSGLDEPQATAACGSLGAFGNSVDALSKRRFRTDSQSGNPGPGSGASSKALQRVPRRPTAKRSPITHGEGSNRSRSRASLRPTRPWRSPRRGPLGLTRPPLTRRPISRPRLRSTARSTRRNSTTRASRAGRGAEGGNEAGRPRG
jgi:hypothetical protein